MQGSRIAVITPIFTEPLPWIEQAVDSVRRQSHDCRHILVADGVERADVVFDDVQVLRLPSQANDGGATPRAIGGRAALEAGFDVIAYLDADDMLEPDFTDEILRAFAAGFDCVGVPALRVTTANQALYFNNGDQAVTWVPHRPHPGLGELCFLRACGLALTGAALRLNEVWARMPRELGGTCDLFWSWAAYDSPARICWTLRPSYGYRITNADVYPSYGLEPPRDANREKSVLGARHHAAWNGLSPAEKGEILARIGITRGYRVRHDHCAGLIKRHAFSPALLGLNARRVFQIRD